MDRKQTRVNSGDIVTTIRLALRASSSELTRRFEKTESGKLESWLKGPRDLVTEADIASDQEISKVLMATSFSANILSEESTSQGKIGDLTWLVDPL
ncbi:MAG: hypothetical protein FJ320_10135 [SAR202 cluster bacterium]|nr:hypothetical protein [SAR202 cluster bacterium]